MTQPVRVERKRLPFLPPPSTARISKFVYESAEFLVCARIDLKLVKVAPRLPRSDSTICTSSSAQHALLELVRPHRFVETSKERKEDGEIASCFDEHRLLRRNAGASNSSSAMRSRSFTAASRSSILRIHDVRSPKFSERCDRIDIPRVERRIFVSEPEIGT
jgi:hypothetical protein